MARMIEQANDYKEQVIQSDSEKRVKEFLNHISKAPKEEQDRVMEFCDRRAKEYMDSELKAKLAGETVENTETSKYVSKESVKNVYDLKDFRKKIYNDYPLVDEPYKKTTEDATYNFANNHWEEINSVVLRDKMKDKSDEYIEAA